MPRRDPLRYFRVESRELFEGLNRAVLDLERGEGSAEEAVQRLLRLAHTLKGAARVVHQAGLADLAHRFEEALQPSESGATAPALEVLTALLRDMARELDVLGAGAEAPSEGPKPVESSGAGQPVDKVLLPGKGPVSSSPLSERSAPRQDTVRLELAELDAVLNRLREAASCLDACVRWAEGLPRASTLAQDLAASGTARDGARELAACLDGLERQSGVLEHARRELAQAHEQAGRLRLHPASALFDYLERVARDAARSLGRRIRFEAEGGEQSLDAAVLVSLQEALQHLVRNAVVHGVEDPSERLAKGKPAEGLLRLSLERRTGRLRVLVVDDGRGIQASAVGRAALARGLLNPAQAEALDGEAAARLLLRGGLSTATSLSELAGRGLGLDAARAQAERLGGHLALRDHDGGGTEAEWTAPDSLASFETLALEADGRRALIPFRAVRELFVLEQSSLVRGPDGEAVARAQGIFPYLPLGSLLNGPQRPGAVPALGLLLRGASGEAVLGVDRVQGLGESVVQPLPDLAPKPRFVSGACLDASGAAHPVLDPEGLVAEARSSRVLPSAEPRTEAPPLLVVDDSLTTRMLEQSILETAGYRVDLASSGEEGLAKARLRRYGLILVDVEMPGMSGFDFLEVLAADPALAGTPAILVSSRAAPEDRRRGAAAGAKDYMVKGEFDQARLLGRIRELLRWNA